MYINSSYTCALESSRERRIKGERKKQTNKDTKEREDERKNGKRM